jgi:pilus assembly protein CpaE
VTKVLLASRLASPLRDLQQCLEEQREFEIHARLISNGHADPLHGLSFQPDLVVLRFDAEHLTELAAWSGKGAASRPPLIVVGPAGHPEAMRLAIRSGAKDFLPEPVTAAELVAALQRVRDEAHRQRTATVEGEIYAIVGAAGGAGTSFIATNIARILAADTERAKAPPPMLVDLDLNFAPLSHYLDIHPDRGLLQALEAVESLDEMAIRGFAAKHRSGLQLLCATSGPTVLSKDVSPEKLSQLFDVLSAHHARVVVDVPHVLDPLTATVFSVSAHVVLVLQQSLLHVRNAARLLQILKSELGVAPERIRVLVNRYQKEALVELADIKRSLNVETLLTIPSHYRSALESADSGVTLYDADRNSAVVRALRELTTTLTGAGGAQRSGLLRRVFRLSPGTGSGTES